MRRSKTQKGITLVALIITIVVLLILALVTINAVRGDGIIGKAQQAKEEYQKKSDEENATLEGYLAYLEENAPGGSSSEGAEDNNGDNSQGEEKENPDNNDLQDGTENEDNSSEEKEAIPTTTTYIGYYADVDGNGSVDGIIYADLAVDGSGKWTNSYNGVYSYSKKVTLNNYYVSQESYQYKNFAAKPVISPIDKVEENDRFYVMALENFTTEGYEEFYWYYNAYGNMSDYAETTSGDFGKGKANTATMINKVYGEGLIDKDLWKYIGSEVAAGWFVPSRGEWGAFGDFATKQGMTNSNYTDYGLSRFYWSSSQCSTYLTRLVDYLAWVPSTTSTAADFYVRLSTTF